MKKTFLILAIMLSILGASVASSLVARAVDSSNEVTDQKAMAIASHCDQLKNQLDVIQTTETAARINRGRAYDTRVSAQMGAFNSRVAANKVDAPQLISNSAEFQTSLKQFQDSFSVYTDGLDSAKNTDCESNPRGFYGWISKARVDRAALNGTVTNLDQVLDRYIEELNDLKERYQTKAPGQ